MSEYQNPPVELAMPSQIQSLKFENLDKNHVILNFIETLLFWFFVWVPFTVFTWILEKFIVPPWVAPLLLLMTLFSCAHSVWAAKAKGFLLRKRDILYKQGVWWRRRTGVSFKRIQHIDISHGPIERKLGMATIKFFTAGGASADLRIPGLPRLYAEQLRTHILEQTGLEDD